jgi:hypothetical protein
MGRRTWGARFLLALFAVLFVELGFIPAARAAIMLSGDSNIANPLDGSAGAPVDAGNRRFFQNVLGSGHQVVVHSDQDPGVSASGLAVPPAINNFFNSIAGVTSSLFSGTITPATLAGKDLFFEIVPNDAFTAGEIAAVNSFVTGGGTIVFLGENGQNFGAADDRINFDLAALGSSLSLLKTTFDSSFHTAGPSRIASDPYTSGVTSFTYAFGSATAGGTVLFRGTGNEPFVTYVPEPSAFAMLATAVLLAARRTRRPSMT